MELINPVTFYDNRRNYNRGTLTHVAIADIHFGAIDPKTQYDILEKQFINKAIGLRFDILAICGDIWEHKFLANSDAISYGVKFVNRLVEICKNINATLVIIAGTAYHDAGQLKLFYHYLEDPSIDIRIVEEIKFEYIKGAKILCIPELYGVSYETYRKYLFESEEYDAVYMHGTLKNSIYGADIETLDTNKAPIFSLDSFKLMRAFLVGGHVHKPGCFESYMYYCGTPIRYKFGEEEAKGFLIVLHNLDTQEHYAYFNEIISFRYDTINLDTMIQSDPKEIIEYLKSLQQQGIHNIKVQFTLNNNDLFTILKNYYRNNSTVKIDIKSTSNNADSRDKVLKESEEVLKKYDKYDYIIDPKLSEYDILTRYINDNKGYEFITTQELIKILEDI